MNATRELAAFRSQVDELDGAESGRIRQSFVESFIDQENPDYTERIGTLKPFSDGLAYSGYLWDFLRTPTVVNEDALWRRLLGFERLLIMWDLHSSDRIRIPDYWKFGKTSVLVASSAIAYEGRAFLPEDLYLFDYSYRWVGILTHEYIDDRRHCLWQQNR